MLVRSVPPCAFNNLIRIMDESNNYLIIFKFCSFNTFLIIIPIPTLSNLLIKPLKLLICLYFVSINSKNPLMIVHRVGFVLSTVIGILFNRFHQKHRHWDIKFILFTVYTRTYSRINRYRTSTHLSEQFYVPLWTCKGRNIEHMINGMTTFL